MRRVAKWATACAVVAAVALAGARSAQATLLLQEDWEGYVLGRASPDLDGWEYVTDVASPPWQTLDHRDNAWIGAARAGDASYPAAYSGQQLVGLNASYLWQNTGQMLTQGVTYTLSVQATAAVSGERIYLYLADHNPLEGPDLASGLATNFQNLPDTDFGWNAYSLSYTATAADAGKELVLGLYGRSATYIDDITLMSSTSASSAPEPTGLALGIIGLAGLALAGRWRQRKRIAT